VKSYFILLTAYVIDKAYVHFSRREHKKELRGRNPANVDKRHRELFVSWFERKVSQLLYNLIIHNLCINYLWITTLYICSPVFK